MKTTTRAFVALAAIAALGACHHDKAKLTTPSTTTGDATPPPTKDEPKPAAVVTADQKVSPGLALSGDIATLCNIKPTANATASTTFDYDKDELTAEDRNVLEQLASCMTGGALKGKAVSLIGRADPRGTEEYNLGLGSRRASSVGEFLGHLGVQPPQLAVTTRGALDATGTDEVSYRTDRRVDVQLKAD